MKHTLWYSEGNRLSYKPVKLKPLTVARCRPRSARSKTLTSATVLPAFSIHKVTTMKRTFQIYRYDPDKDAKPYMQTVEVELDGHERMLLDALMKLKAAGPDAVVPPLVPRRRLRLRRDEHQRQERPGLPDQHAHAQGQPIVLKPLPGLPVIRDLIVDMTQFFKQYNSIKPYLHQRQRAAREGAAAVARGARRARTACTSASCARAAPPAAPASGGTPTSSSARPACCRPTASSPTAATKPPPSAWTTWKTRTACSAATRS
jgi:hypothetical protein